MLLLRPLGRQPYRGYRFYLGSVGVFGAAGQSFEGWARRHCLAMPCRPYAVASSGNDLL